MNWFWPIRTGRVFFDVWTVCHFSMWVVIGFNWGALSDKLKAMQLWWAPLIFTLVFALLWEILEWRVLEPAGMVRYPEIWFNRWLSDPLVGLTGVSLGLWLVRHQ